MIKRKIAVATGTRADWGLLSPLAASLRDSGKADVYVLATNMHLDPARGNTISEIEKDGFETAARIEMPLVEETPAAIASGMGVCMQGFAKALSDIAPDSIIILGDRYEMLAVASVATVMRIPIIHIAGGEISQGAIDDNIRHAISKLSSLHLAATEEYRQRLIAMGENPSRVINTGAIGVYNIFHRQLMDNEELNGSLGFEVDGTTLLVTLHPATASGISAASMADEMLAALDRFRDNRILFTYPNNDAEGAVIIERINSYAAANPGRVHIVPSLGQQRYLSALRYVAAVVGNSSSGIVEVPSMRIPVVNIRPRQNGRLVSAAVINANPERDDIARCIAIALSEIGKRIASEVPNPYFRENTLKIMTDAILGLSPREMGKKIFYDIEHPVIL